MKKRFMLVTSAVLLDKLKRIALDEHRSANRQLELILEAFVSDWERSRGVEDDTSTASFSR